MSEGGNIYIAGMGMITAIGANLEMTAAALKAEISGYALSDFYNRNDEPITMASVPDAVFSQLELTLEEGDRHNECHERITKMSIIALHEACAKHADSGVIPLVFASTDKLEDVEELSPLVSNLENNCEPWISTARFRNIVGDRALGLQAIDFVFRHIDQISQDYVLVGSSDSFQDQSRLDPLDAQNRLKTASNMDGFAPGEAACFILLTQKPELAMVQNDYIIALNPPGLAKEPGHLNCDAPYLGEGLDQAFKNALTGPQDSRIDCIYSSMNGEHYWAKEYGVAYIRNSKAFTDPVEIEHPADLLGDTGSAAGLMLVALAAENLYKQTRAKAHLVYSSSDSAPGGAIVLEKIAVTTKA